MAIVSPGSTWQNQCPARILLKVTLYRPTCYAKKVKCPVLIVCAERDSLVPLEAVKKMALKIKLGELFSLPVGHFDVYTGKSFETVVEVEGNFLEKHLGLRR
jgi:pimeloyl-ACP methyl ester carboxylesterase